jgi:hypothetical protein
LVPAERHVSQNPAPEFVHEEQFGAHAVHIIEFPVLAVFVLEIYPVLQPEHPPFAGQEEHPVAHASQVFEVFNTNPALQLFVLH